MEWAALPLVAAMLGVDDVELLVENMTVIRDELRAREN